MKLTLAAILIIAAGFGQAPKGPEKQKRVDRVEVADDGSIQIIHNDGTVFKIPKDKRQESTEPATIAAGGQVAGWLVDYQVCCQNYPIPTLLMVYRPGKPLRRFEAGQFIGAWVFVEEPKQVAFCTNTAHFESHPHYELHDIESGRLIASWDGPATNKAPRWVNWIDCDR